MLVMVLTVSILLLLQQICDAGALNNLTITAAVNDKHRLLTKNYANGAFALHHTI